MRECTHTYLAQCLDQNKCYELYREEMLQVWKLEFKSTHFQASKEEITIFNPEDHTIPLTLDPWTLSFLGYTCIFQTG